jgi:DUF4097 and DUF4098 domain-containing protein YvlB
MKGWCSGALAAALMLFSGCELMIESDHGSVTIADGTVTNLRTRTGSVEITMPGR